MWFRNAIYLFSVTFRIVWLPGFVIRVLFSINLFQILSSKNHILSPFNNLEINWSTSFHNCNVVACLVSSHLLTSMGLLCLCLHTTHCLLYASLPALQSKDVILVATVVTALSKWHNSFNYFWVNQSKRFQIQTA